MNSSDVILSAAMRLYCSIMGAMGTEKPELVSTRMSIQNLMQDTDSPDSRKVNPKLKLWKNTLKVSSL